MTTQPTALRLADALEWLAPGQPGVHREAAAELRRLHAEVERKYDAIQRLWKERDELRADAERYRWLRDNHVGDAEVGNYGVVQSRSVCFAWHSPSWEAGQRMNPVTLDAAIDAARSKK